MYAIFLPLKKIILIIMDCVSFEANSFYLRSLSIFGGKSEEELIFEEIAVSKDGSGQFSGVVHQDYMK